MPEINEIIQQLEANFVIKQGKYSLTADAMQIRDQRPLHCGDDYVFNFTYINAGGEPVDITGATIKFTAKYARSDAEGDAIVTKTAALGGDPTTGEFSVTLVNTDVQGPELIFGYYDIQMTISGASETIIYGDIEFLPNITQTVP